MRGIGMRCLLDRAPMLGSVWDLHEWRFGLDSGASLVRVGDSNTTPRLRIDTFSGVAPRVSLYALCCATLLSTQMHTSV